MKLHIFSEDKKVVFKGYEVVIYEDGWWMKRETYDFLNENGLPKAHIALDRNKETKEITTIYLPASTRQ